MSCQGLDWPHTQASNLPVTILVTDFLLSCSLHRRQSLDSCSHVVGAEMGVSLDHDLGLPAAGPLDRIEIDARHSQPAGEGVAQVMKAEARYLSHGERRPPVSIKVDEPLALR
jgi:hypothetical protein